MPKTIVIADDDLDDLEMLEEAFLYWDSDASVHTVVSGTELIEYLSKCERDEVPGLIVLDYNMPNMNGAQVLKYLISNEQYRQVPAVVWSTSNSELYKAECKANGAKEYFVKPVRIDDMKELANQMLALTALK